MRDVLLIYVDIDGLCKARKARKVSILLPFARLDTSTRQNRLSMTPFVAEIMNVNAVCSRNREIIKRSRLRRVYFAGRW